MLKIALLTDGASLNSVIYRKYSDARYLLIADADSGKLLQSIPRNGQPDEVLADRIVAEDCEAVISGPIDEAPFVRIADEGCATRYDGSGLPALLAVDKMNDYALPLLTDFIGGTGCHPGDESNCTHHRHD